LLYVPEHRTARMLCVLYFGMNARAEMRVAGDCRTIYQQVVRLIDKSNVTLSYLRINCCLYVFELL
jgi:hypothetical protein